MSNRDNQRREVATTLTGAAELLNEIRVQVNLALVRAEDWLREFLATDDDTVVVDEPNTAVAQMEAQLSRMSLFASWLRPFANMRGRSASVNWILLSQTRAPT